MSISQKTKRILVTSACSCLVASTAIVLPLSFLPLFSPFAEAQSRKVRYIPPSNLDAPKTSGAGASRSAGCSEACLIALLPNLEIDKAPVPQTIADRPTIYFLSPKYRGSVTFRLDDDSVTPDKKTIYQKKFDIDNEAGIIAFKLPDDAPMLEVGKIYTWKFTIQSFPTSKFVYGSIRRVLPTKKLTEQLSKITNPVDRASLFAQDALWFDTVETLAEAQRTVPQNSDVVNEWKSILESANLNRILPYKFVSQK